MQGREQMQGRPQPLQAFAWPLDKQNDVPRVLHAAEQEALRCLPE